LSVLDTPATQKKPHSGDEQGVSKWPKKVKVRGKVLAKVYGKCRDRDSYRVSWIAAGGRMMKSFPTYSGPGE
jgi:hypothetical protein